MKEKKVFIHNDAGEKLVGIETLPENAKEKHAAVVLVHGFYVGKEESGMFTELAARLTKEGLAVYRFDFSGCGESEGKWSETTLTKLKTELTKILEFVKQRPFVDVNRIAIVAQSLGSVVTIALRPKEVKCIALLGTPVHPKAVLQRLFGSGYNKQGESTRTMANGGKVTVKSEFFSDFDKHDLLKEVKKIKCPLLFVHGGADDKVPASEMLECFEAANAPKEKIIIEGASHNMKPKQEEMYEIITAWLEKHLA
ncbi:alpha/beta fold hydrolase [Candidatus Micrarchaeota archaeon]|nr:alpha/beta fold hydrolase [Candidatus Micrarchaeota archaeon]